MKSNFFKENDKYIQIFHTILIINVCLNLFMFFKLEWFKAYSRIGFIIYFVYSSFYIIYLFANLYDKNMLRKHQKLFFIIFLTILINLFTNRSSVGALVKTQISIVFILLLSSIDFGSLKGKYLLSIIIPINVYWIAQAFNNYRLKFRISVNKEIFNLINSNSIALLLLISYIIISKIFITNIVPTIEFKNKKSKIYEYIFIFFFTIYLIALIKLQSRTALLSFLFYNFSLFLMKYEIYIFNIDLMKFLRYFFWALILTPLILTVMSQIDFFSNITINNKNLFSGRESLVIYFFEKMNSNPLNWILGTGSNNLFVGPKGALSFHNLYLQIIFNFGLLIFSIFLTIIVRVFKNSDQLNKNILYTILIINSFETVALHTNFMLLIWLPLASFQNSKHENRQFFLNKKGDTNGE